MMNGGNENDCCIMRNIKKSSETQENDGIPITDLNARNKIEIIINRNEKQNWWIQKLNQPKKRLIIFGCVGILLIIMAYLTLVFSPVSMIINAEMKFTEGSESFSFWKEPPVDIFLKTYVFNVTNQEKFLAGEEKLKVEEVGPFYYREKMVMRNITFNDNGTVTYIPHRQISLVPGMSVTDPETTRFIVPNVPLIAIASMLHDASFLKNFGVSSFLRYMETQPFLNLSVTQFLMGYEDPLVKVAGTLIPSWIPFKKFGVLERLFAEGLNTVTLNIKPVTVSPTGAEDDTDYRGQYLIDTFNGRTELTQWIANAPNRRLPNRCASVQGTTEGVLFNMNIKPNVTFWLYRKAFCRSVPFQYSHTTLTKNGIKAFQFKVKEDAFDTPEENPQNFCFVKKGTKAVLPSGLSSLTPCYYGFPIAMSFPHFYLADPKLVGDIDGMEPNASVHNSSLRIQPDLGIILSADIRVQINIVMFKNKYILQAAPFNDLVLPLFWCDYVVADLGSRVEFLLRLGLVYGPVVEVGLVVFLCLTGLLVVILATLGRVVSLREQRRTEQGHKSEPHTTLIDQGPGEDNRSQGYRHWSCPTWYTTFPKLQNWSTIQKAAKGRNGTQRHLGRTAHLGHQSEEEQKDS